MACPLPSLPSPLPAIPLARFSLMSASVLALPSLEHLAVILSFESCLPHPILHCYPPFPMHPKLPPLPLSVPPRFALLPPAHDACCQASHNYIYMLTLFTSKKHQACLRYGSRRGMCEGDSRSARVNDQGMLDTTATEAGYQCYQAASAGSTAVLQHWRHHRFALFRTDLFRKEFSGVRWVGCAPLGLARVLGWVRSARLGSGVGLGALGLASLGCWVGALRSASASPQCSDRLGKGLNVG